MSDIPYAGEETQTAIESFRASGEHAVDVLDRQLDEQFCIRDESLTTAYEMMRIIKGLDDSRVVETAEAEQEAVRIRDEALDRLVGAVILIKSLNETAQHIEAELEGLSKCEVGGVE